MAPGPYEDPLLQAKRPHHMLLLQDDPLPQITTHMSKGNDTDEAEILITKKETTETKNNDGESRGHREEEDEDDKERGNMAEEEEKKRRKKKEEATRDHPRRKRDLTAYWLLGFCNNFTYWVMITAAYDLLTPHAQMYTERSQGEEWSMHQKGTNFSVKSPPNPHVTDDTWGNVNVTSQPFINTFKCQKHSTGAILVADTLPATAVSLAAPLVLLVGVSARVALVGGLCFASYLTLGLAPAKFVFLGVALASASRGFSDTTFLGHASHYHKDVLSVWSSGTGVATFVGPLLYSSLTTAGFTPAHSLLVFLVVPLLIFLSFWCILSKYHQTNDSASDPEAQDESVRVVANEDDLLDGHQKMLAIIREKLRLFMRAQRYLMPLAIFYVIMYFTNQGLLELVYFPGSVLTHAQQYSWSNTVRCLGTLISRSAHNLFLLPSVWVYDLLALMILVVVGTEAHFHYLPSEYIVFTLLLVQGLLEGSAFRATVFKIHKKTSAEEREFCLAVFPTALFPPAVLAGLASIPTHDILCRNHMYG